MNAEISIVDFEAHHAPAFRNLNMAWIEQYFELVEEDIRVLSDPQLIIIDAGGFIKVAIDQKTGSVVGVCAMKKRMDLLYDYELSKMAVDERFQGRGIGQKLISACIDKASQLGGRQIYLETNSKLKVAIHLYEKMGFQFMAGHGSPFERVDAYMTLDLTEKTG